MHVVLVANIKVRISTSKNVHNRFYALSRLAIAAHMNKSAIQSKIADIFLFIADK